MHTQYINVPWLYISTLPTLQRKKGLYLTESVSEWLRLHIASSYQKATVQKESENKLDKNPKSRFSYWSSKAAEIMDEPELLTRMFWIFPFPITCQQAWQLFLAAEFPEVTDTGTMQLLVNDHVDNRA